jgi:hypothetical protein
MNNIVKKWLELSPDLEENVLRAYSRRHSDTVLPNHSDVFRALSSSSPGHKSGYIEPGSVSQRRRQWYTQGIRTGIWLQSRVSGPLKSSLLNIRNELTDTYGKSI